jgi:hypothetical protein
MELPSVLRSLPSRSSTVTVSKALLRLGRLLVQLPGVAVDGKLTRLRSRSAFPCSHHLVRLVDHRPSPFPDWLSTLSQPPDHEQGDGCLTQHQRPWAGLRHAQLVGQLPDISYSHAATARQGSGAECEAGPPLIVASIQPPSVSP